MAFRPNAVAIVANALYRDLQIALAEKLKDEFRSEVHLYVGGRNSVGYFERKSSDGLFASINVNPYHQPIGFESVADEKSIVDKARYFERRYQRSYNSFAVGDRHFGRGFAPGGLHHPRSRQSETSSYLQYLQTYNEYFEYWEKELREKEVDLLIDGGIREAAVARANGIVRRSASLARFENRYYWMTDEYGFSESLYNAFQSAKAISSYEIVDDMPFAQKAINKIAIQRQTFFGMIKRCILQIKNHAYYHYKGSEKAKGYYLSSELYSIVRKWIDYRKIRKSHVGRVGDLRDSTFVFFPLQVEPELALQSRSPEYFYQLSAIISVARDLPAGVKLVVKEHIPAIGRRPIEFYDQIAELKNVVLMDPNENGVEIVKSAAAVVTITGTAGQEAAIRGIPVISFGRHNLFNVMSHVLVIEDEADLPAALEKVLDQNFDKENALLEASRYVAALKDISFNMESLNTINTDGFSQAAVDASYQQLMRTLPDSPLIMKSGSSVA